MVTRRSFMSGMLAAGFAPRPTWADVGSPVFLSAGRKPEGTHVLCGLNSVGSITFELPLPARGHAAAAHPTLAEAVAFARRPGTYAVVLDCSAGRQKARLEAPAGRHFYGHGVFSADGELLFTTENDFEAARGVIGVWDTRHGYERIGEFDSGGIGPHDIKMLSGEASLVVANGGIETHPEAGRTKLNIPTMRSNLSYLSVQGELTDQLELNQAHQKNSIRHLAVAADDTVAFAMQWQGDSVGDQPLLGTHHRRTGQLSLAKQASVRRMKGYLGSVAITNDGERIAVTSPRSGIIQEFRHTDLIAEIAMEDVCGVAATDAGFMITAGTGVIRTLCSDSIDHSIAWDNHLVSL